jgi:hypothetical protein
MAKGTTAADMLNADTVDAIVARVMAALRGEPAPPTAPQGTTAGRTPAPQEPAEVVLAERVVTAAALAEKTRPGQAVWLVEGAVVTPAARDFIKQHRLRVGRAIPRGADPARRSSLRILVCATDHALRGALQSLPSGACEQRLAGTTDEAVADAVAALARGEVDRMVLVTGEPHRAACEANRHRAVRAAAVRPSDDVVGVLAECRANLLAVPPRGSSVQAWRKLLQACAGT